MELKCMQLQVRNLWISRRLIFWTFSAAMTAKRILFFSNIIYEQFFNKLVSSLLKVLVKSDSRANICA